MKEIREVTEEMKKEAKRLENEMRERIAGYIVGAFGLVAGLAWNDAIKSLIEYFFPLKQNSVAAKFIYALSITLVLVLVTVYIVRFFKREKEKGE